MLLPTLAAAQVHRCTVEGRVVLQDRPCAGVLVEQAARALPSVSPVEARPPIGEPAYEQAKEAQRRKDLEEFGRREGRRRQAAAQEEAKALARRCGEVGEAEPYIGARAEWVRACSTWGEPSRVNNTTTAHGSSQQWFYRYRGYLYFDAQARLVAIQK